MQVPIKWFIGYDNREAVAFYTFQHSLMRHCSVPISIIPLSLNTLDGIYTRPRDPKQSNDFSFTRFLVPYLCDFRGMAVFSDCDMLMRADPAELIEDVEMLISAPVSVVKHHYVPRDTTKYLGSAQIPYPCKNWSSLMVFNNSHMDCRKLTPEYVNTAPALDLHQFLWAGRVNALDPTWNHLVSEYYPNPKAKLVHFTVGGPYFNEYAGCEFAHEWFAERDLMNHCEQRVFDETKNDRSSEVASITGHRFNAAGCPKA